MVETDRQDPASRDTLAETGPGLADEAVGKGQLWFDEIGPAETERQIEALRRRGWAGACGHADDSEAHPS